MLVANYDEALVPHYQLPDPLIMADGTVVTSGEQWRAARRAQVLDLFADHVYGVTPRATLHVSTTVLEETATALDGLARRRQVAITFGAGTATRTLHLLLYLPADAPGPVPCFMGLNFHGNQTVHADPAILLPTTWLPDRVDGVVDNRATDATRGASASRWPAEQIVARGYGVITAYCGDFAPDDAQLYATGVRALFAPDDGDARGATDWGAMGLWAWGLSRMLDYGAMDPDVDASRIAVIGHSRLGKAALWAAAQDERFALAISNNSGCGGAAISRRRFGETVKLINDRFPHWFCPNFRRYNDYEDDLPVDQHMLLALIAPRPLYVASAQDDLWADPRGEFLGALHASPVYRLLGTEGLPADDLPPVDTPLAGRIGYHIRRGGHDITAYDWERYLEFADRHM